MTVPGRCHSQGCHGYLLGSLASPFRFTRHLFHTYLWSMGLICKYSCCNNIVIAFLAMIANQSKKNTKKGGGGGGGGGEFQGNLNPWPLC